jgi:hypothetical protein
MQVRFNFSFAFFSTRLDEIERVEQERIREAERIQILADIRSEAEAVKVELSRRLSQQRQEQEEQRNATKAEAARNDLKVGYRFV